MLTLAYIRVSTEDQVEYSPEAQASRCRQHAAAHDLGAITFLRDEGLSGKDLNRPGIQELIELVEAGRVAHVIVWRLDRLSRDQGDLNRLVRAFERHCVSLHSVSEGQVDLNTAAGRMQIGVHGVFAQFYREHIVENVKSSQIELTGQGHWINRPPTGYSMIDGRLIPNEKAPLVRRVFELRQQGHSYSRISEMVGMNYSTVRQVVHNRVYLGLTRLRDNWFTGIHEPLVTQEEFDAAHRGHVPGRRRGRHVLSGRVRCGLCTRLVAIDYNERAQPIFKCRHRGKGCAQPGRSGNGLERAALLGLRLLGEDTELQEAIRAELHRHASPPATADDTASAIAAIERKRRKLLELHYADQISPDLFADEERQLSAQAETLRTEQAAADVAASERNELAQRFDQVAAVLQETDIDALWDAATHSERRTLVENLIGVVEIHPDHLKVEVIGAPPILVTLAEVGLKAGTRTCVSEGGLEPPRPCGH